MRTGIRIDGLDALLTDRRPAPRGLLTWALAGLAGLAPLTASTAAPEAPAPSAASSAVVELVPLQPAAEAIAAPVSDEAPAPSAPQEAVLGRGSASYYAARFDGRRTASGERFDNGAMTAAHRSLPFGTLVRVTNLANGRSVIVRINDRGPFSRDRMIDVSRAAASELGLVARGHGMVELALIAD
ncbi:septal ring lytic transglycosylase RlpA family protein [Erythrobacter donghaensis]|jgi:rare lipoprotein A|uniref:septal ring lytic transglycosylase RlpA family protein n=1 Tax=Erythrobacter donghaensis TaxID=267135 RepID=UPI0009BE457A|nr:septal ring lytic transglycosylase RlpA family protein [Erythrobacter donghaensis]